MSSPTESAEIPETIQEVQSIIGWDATWNLIERFGGTEISVPRRYQAAHPLAQAIGPAAAPKFFQHFAGCQFYLPKMAADRLSARNRELYRRYRAGEPLARLTRDYGLSVRQARWILSRQDLRGEPAERRLPFDQD